MPMLSLSEGTTPVGPGVEILPLTRAQEIDTSRNRALLVADANTIAFQGQDTLTQLQQALQHGARYGFWETPWKWGKTERGEATMNVDMRKRIESFLPADCKRLLTTSSHNPSDEDTRAKLMLLLDGAILAQTRYLVLLRMGPSGLGRKGRFRSLDPSTVRGIAYSYAPQMLALSISKTIKSGLRATGGEYDYFKVLEAADFEQLSASAKEYTLLEAGRMHRLAQQGCWDDVPQIGQSRDLITRVNGPSVEKPKPRGVKPHLPLPDEFASEMGSKSYWLMTELGPNMFTVGQAIEKIWEGTSDPALTAAQLRRRRASEVTSFLKSYVWRDSTGTAFERPPFPIRLTQHGTRRTQKLKPKQQQAPSDTDSDAVKLLAWPPTKFGEVMGLMHNVQLAHLFVVAMSTAGRKSETVNLTRDCVRFERNGLPYASGHTFKLVRRHDGELRDWVLPDIAVTAIEQQVRLLHCAEAIGPMNAKPQVSRENDRMHLWAQMNGLGASIRTAPLVDLGKALRSYAQALGMSLTPGGQTFRSHRFRKTVARLVALAITQAPKVLMDVFGHKSIEMTLYYILADKDLRIEIEQVSRELRVMRAKNTIVQMLEVEDSTSASYFSKTFGGPASHTIRNAINEQRVRVHKRGDNWGADTVAELAEILTLQGKAWQYVRPGVICTKFPGTESGPCNKSKGHPEPARCQSHCKHRLEEPFLREDVDGAIRDCIREFTKAEQDGEDLTLEFWSAQIRIHLNRFDDLRAKWATDPVVGRIELTIKEAA
jgi:integrase